MLALVPMQGSAVAATAPWSSIASPSAMNTTVNPVPDIAWDGTGLWLAWGTDNIDVEVRRWNGSSWTSYPQPVNEATRNKMPSITWDGTRPWVAWNDDANAVRVASWNGSTWTQVASPGSAGAQYATPDLLWANGALHAAWQDSGRVVRVARWTGASWTSLGSPGNGGTANSYPNLAWDGTELYVAWSQPSLALVSRLAGGTSWTAHSTLAVSASNALPTLAFVGGRMYLMHEVSSGTALTWWDGAQYRTVPSPGGGPSVFAYGTLAWTGTRMWTSYVLDPDTVEVARYDPVAPNAPASLAQLEADAATSIAGGAWTRFGGTNALVLRGTASDAEPNETLLPWVELHSGGGFTATCGAKVTGATFAGTSVAATTAGSGVSAPTSVTGLTNGSSYTWRMCVTDRFGFPSTWTAFGGAPDLRLDTSVPTATPTSPAAGATGVAVSPALTATYTDPSPARPGRLDFELCSSSACTTVLQSGSSASGLASGASGSWTPPTALAPSTSYWWRARAADEPGNVGAWSSAQGFTTSASTIAVSVDAAAVSVGSLAAGTDGTATSIVSVSTDSPGGYQLNLRDESDSWAADVGASTIADWTGTSATPTLWAAGTAGGMGVTVFSVTSAAAKLARWGTGTSATDFSGNRYAGLEATTDTVAHLRTSFSTSAETISLGWRVNVPASQPSGTYQATISITAVALP